MPIVFFLLLIIPIVDYGETLHGWSKLLNCLNIILLPQWILFLFGHSRTFLFNFIPLSIVVLLISFGLSTVVFRTSRNDAPPSYHNLFAAGSFIGSLSIISTVAKEVVSIMKAFGVLSGRSDSFVGLSILAYGNSVGDLFSSYSLAKQGYQQMAFAACFGGPMFSKM
jgi:solute carrier family 24 (sodium/potassium/calcium exchanger), member 6